MPLSIPEFHEEIYGLVANSSLKRICIIAPTGFGKSSVISFAVPIWAACYAHYKDILIVSASAEFAEYRLRLIKSEFQNNYSLSSDFQIVPSDLWRSDEIILSNGVRITAKGRGAQITGMRPDLIVVDDIETELQAKSEVERASIKEWFYKTLMNRPSPEGRIIMIGSISSKVAFLNNFNTEEAKQIWFTKSYATEGCRSIWKERWSDDDLRKKKAELAPYSGIYEALYEADVSQIQKYTFKSEWLRYYNTKPEENLPVCIAIDPAIGQNLHNDYTAISVGCMDLKGQIWVLEFIKRKFNLEALELFTVLFNLYDIWRPVKIGIESIGFQKYIKLFFESECKTRGKYPNIIEITPETKTTKYARINGLAPFFQSGKILLKQDMFGLIEEINAYPEVEHDDGLDSLSMLKDMLLSTANLGNRNKGVIPQLRGRYTIHDNIKSL
jgi:predicted phage terminase large subunit-like protein